MSEKITNRRKFLKFLGLSTAATLTGTGVMASSIIKEEEIKTLKPDQKEFMLNYSRWMNEFIEVIKIERMDSDNIQNKRKMILLTEEAEAWQAKLNTFMADSDFAAIYTASIQRMSDEI